MTSATDLFDEQFTGEEPAESELVAYPRARRPRSSVVLAPAASAVLLLFGAAGLAFAPVASRQGHSAADRPPFAVQMNSAATSNNLLPAAPPLDDRAAAKARVVNAARPVTVGELQPARPFVMTTGGDDRERAIDCLAAAAWYEAGNGPQDQRAVAQVVLNRVRHPAFPKTVCGVVFEGAARTTGCQFTFTCDGSLFRRHPSIRQWSDARNTATEMLFGGTDAAVGRSTHYHTDWVTPPWDRDMDKVAVVRSHLFFRWHGGRGDAGAFTSSYAGSEPRIPMLAALSPAHGEITAPALVADTADAALAAVPAASAGPPASPPPSGREVLPDRASTPTSGVFLVTLSAGAGADSFLALAQQQCAGLSDCRFIGWTDPSHTAERLPLSGTAIDAIAFTYTRRNNSAGGEAKWNCTAFRRAEQSECLHRTA